MPETSIKFPSKEKPIKNHSEALLLNENTKYIQEHFPVMKDEFLKISHLWAENFRITLYKKEKTANTVLAFDKLVYSYFIRLTVNDSGEISHKIDGEKDAS